MNDMECTPCCRYHLDTDKPLAERLIFRQPRAMTVDVEADKARYVSTR